MYLAYFGGVTVLTTFFPQIGRFFQSFGHTGNKYGFVQHLGYVGVGGRVFVEFLCDDYHKFNKPEFVRKLENEIAVVGSICHSQSPV